MPLIAKLKQVSKHLPEHWNYRVLHKTEGKYEHYEIHEVHYNKHNKIVCWSVEPMAPYGETLTELKHDLVYLTEALSKPTLVEVTKRGKPCLIPYKHSKKKA